MAQTHLSPDAVRARIRAWVVFFRALAYNDKNDKDMAEDLGVGTSTLNGVLSGKRTAGLDFVVAVSLRFGVPIDTLIRYEPNAAWPALQAQNLAPKAKH